MTLRKRAYLVTIRETHYRSKEIEARTSEEARVIAEEQNWNAWPLDDSRFEGASEIMDVIHKEE